MTATLPATSDAAIWGAWMAAFHAPTLAVADELGLFAALRDGPASAPSLAATLRIEERAAIAMAGLMTSLELLVRVADGYALSDAGRAYLLPESPFYWGGMLRRIRDNPLDCRKLIDSLRRGKAAADARLNGMWSAPAPPAEALVAFTEAMHAHSFALAMRVVPRFPLAGVARVLDAGGGSGSYAIAALLHDPALRATVLDLAPVCGVAERYARAHGVADRFATAAADMFGDPWPAGHDRVLMSDVFHDWDDERCVALARRAHDALAPGGRIWLHEMTLDDDLAGPPQAAAYSMIMVFVTEGRQRSARELAALLAAGGFGPAAVTPTSGGFALIEAARLS